MANTKRISEKLVSTYAQLGKFTSHWNNLELYWFFAFLVLARDAPGAIPVTIYNFIRTNSEQRRLVLAVADAALSDESGKKYCKRLRALKEETDVLAAHRNAVVHGLYFVDGDKLGVSSIVNPSKPNKLQDKDLSIELPKLIETTEKLIHDLYRFLLELDKAMTQGNQPSRSSKVLLSARPPGFKE